LRNIRPRASVNTASFSPRDGEVDSLTDAAVAFLPANPKKKADKTTKMPKPIRAAAKKVHSQEADRRLTLKRGPTTGSAHFLMRRSCMFQFSYKLKVAERVKAKCERHPRYNPSETDEKASMADARLPFRSTTCTKKGSCSTAHTANF
jgi:hypothetical protein